MTGAGTRFLADAMLGRLARRLRMLGLDVAYERDAEDSRILYRALSESRFLLTRDRVLAGRLPGCAFLVKGTGPREEFSSISRFLKDLGIAFSPLSRCLECNRELAAVSPDEARPFVPRHVLETAEGFRRCPVCGKVYWLGTHAERMRKEIAQMEEEMR